MKFFLQSIFKWPLMILWLWLWLLILFHSTLANENINWCPLVCKCQPERLNVMKKFPTILLPSLSDRKPIRYQINEQVDKTNDGNKTAANNTDIVNDDDNNVNQIRFRVDCDRRKIYDVKLLFDNSSSMYLFHVRQEMEQQKWLQSTSIDSNSNRKILFNTM